MKPIEFFIAFRFLKEGRSQTGLIFAGATAGVAVIVFLTSLISGLQQTLIDQTMGLQAHVVVEPEELTDSQPLYTAQGDEYVFSRIEPRPARIDDIDDWRLITDQFYAEPEVTAVAPIVTGPASAVRGQVLEPIQIRGVEPESYQHIVDVEDRLRRGDFRVDEQGIVIGYELARYLDVDLGDRMRVLVGDDDSRSFTVRGVFDLGSGTPNQTWAFVSIREAQTMFDLGDSVTGVLAVTVDLFEADALTGRLQPLTEHDVVSWQETNRDLLRALRTQNASTILIAVFVAIAVALGIASVLVVTVVQKRGQVGVLRAMGASMGTVQRIFLIQGALVGLVGSIFGSVLGTALAIIFNDFIRDDQGEVIFPIEPSPSIFIMACLLATVTGLLAAIVPARRAAKLDPADAITNA